MDDSTPRCPHCGGMVAADSPVCPNCGRPPALMAAPVSIRNVGQPPTPPPAKPARRHSGFGIASAIIGVGIWTGTCLLLAMSYLANESNMESAEGIYTLVGTGCCGVLAFSLIGLTLGLVGVVEGQRNRLFPIVGTALNATFLAVLVGLVLLGILAG